MTTYTLFVTGEDTVVFFEQLNTFCDGVPISYDVLDITARVSYDLDTSEKSDAFYGELVRLLGVYSSLNFTIIPS